MKQIKVYIASAYTIGDTALNVRRQMDMVHELMMLGYVPYAPLAITHFQHMMHPRPYEEWLAFDFEWIKACDVLLRLESESAGADREVTFARAQGIPVVYSVKDLLVLELKEAA